MWNSVGEFFCSRTVGLRRKDAGKTWKWLVEVATLSRLIPPHWLAGKDTNTPKSKSGGLGGLQEWEEEEAKRKVWPSHVGCVRTDIWVVVVDAPVRSHVEEDVSADFAVILLVMSRSLN